MNENLRDIFFQLLRLGLWGEGAGSLSRVLTAEEWAAIYQRAKTQTVEGLLFDALSRLPQEQQPPKELLLKWAVRVDQIERYNKQMNQVIVEQNAVFSAEGVKPILLKGQGVAACYPNPLHRSSGDVDWWFEEDGYDRVLESLRKIQHHVNTSLNFSLDYKWRGIEIEHHRHLFDVKNPFKIGYLKKLYRQFRTKQQTLQIIGQPVTLLAPELQILQVNVHILKHLIGYGIGLRQLCDSAVLYKAYRDCVDADELKKMYQKVGILKWVHVLHALLVRYLGLPEEYLPFPVPKQMSPDWMMEEIWIAGNFGIYDERFVDAKVSAGFARPDAPRRLWRNFRLYFPYAPQEVFFFPVRRATARLTAFLKR